MQIAVETAPSEEPKSWLHHGETFLMCAVTAAMIVLPVYTAFARFATGNSPGGTIPFVQHLTVWAGFVGALIASGAKTHLALATGEFIPEGRFRHTAQFIVALTTALVTTMLAYASIVMIEADKQSGEKLFQIIPAWWSELIIPVALVLIAGRTIANLTGPQGPSAKKRQAVLAVLAILAFTAAVGSQWYTEYGIFVSVNELLEAHASTLAWVSCLVIVVAVLLGAPMFVALSGLPMALFAGKLSPIATVPIEISRLVASSTLPAIPLLTLCGFALAEGGASVRLVRAARAMVGFLPGGLAMMVVIVCALFTTLTGGSGVTIIALGGLVLPMLLKEGYPEGFSLGLVTAAGSLGLLFPPSLPVILYSVVSESSADRLFVAGLVPGLLMLVFVLGYGMWVGSRIETKRAKFEWKEARDSMWEAKWELAIPVVLLGLIFTGKATIVEASALAAGMALCVETFVFHDFTVKKDLPRVITHSGRLTGAVVIVLATAMGLTAYLVEEQIPNLLLEWVTTHIHSRILFLLALNVILLILGSVLEIYSAIVILAPLLVPLAGAFQIDPLHLGILFLANLELGFLFPPVGLNLLLASSRFRKPLPQVYKMAFPFLCILAVGVLVITYVPALSVGVADALMPPRGQQAEQPVP